MRIGTVIKWKGWGLLLLVFSLDLYLLVTGSAWLERPLNAGGTFPLGTLVGWSFLIAWPLLFLLLMPTARPGQKPGTFKALRFVRGMLLAAFALGLGWGFCGRLASGNWANAFQNAPPGLAAVHHLVGSCPFPAAARFFDLGRSLALSPRPNPVGRLVQKMQSVFRPLG